MKSKKLANKKVSVTTQKFLDIAEIKEDCVVLKDGTLRAAILVSSINFALKSEDEQNAIISAYVGFLNTLQFPMQIVIQSRMLDIDSYLTNLQKIEKEQTNDLIKIQTNEYIGFIKNFTESTDIMNKNFFIVIPYAPPVFQGKKKIGGLFGKNEPTTEKKKEAEQFEESRTQLAQRSAIVAQGLSSAGVRVATLGTEEIIELFYKIFNPGELEKPIVTI